MKNDSILDQLNMIKKGDSASVIRPVINSKYLSNGTIDNKLERAILISELKHFRGMSINSTDTDRVIFYFIEEMRLSTHHYSLKYPTCQKIDFLFDDEACEVMQESLLDKLSSFNMDTIVTDSREELDECILIHAVCIVYKHYIDIVNDGQIERQLCHHIFEYAASCDGATFKLTDHKMINRLKSRCNDISMYDIELILFIVKIIMNCGDNAYRTKHMSDIDKISHFMQVITLLKLEKVGK